MPSIVPDEVTFEVFDVVASSTGPFNFGFQHTGKPSLRVTVDNVSVDFNLTPGSVVDAAGYDGGSFSLLVAAANARVVIYRLTTVERDANLSGSNLTFSGLNGLLNEFAYTLQELRRDVARAMLANFGETGGVVDPDDIAAVAAIADAVAIAAGIDAEILILAGLSSEISAISALGIEDLEAIAAGLAAKADQATTYTKDETDGFLDGKQDVSLVNYAALTGIGSSARSDGMQVYVSARAITGDGGDGWWRFDAASAATANGGTILAPDAGTGRWLRIFSGAVNLDWFCVGDGSTNDLTAFLAAAGLGLPMRGRETAIYLLSGRTLLPNDFDLDLCGGTLELAYTAASGDTAGDRYALYNAIQSFGTSYTVTYTAYTRTISLGATNTDIAVGDTVGFFGTSLDERWPITYRRVTELVSGTSIKVDEAIPYAIGGTVTMRKIPHVGEFKLRNGVLDCAGIADGTANALGVMMLRTYRYVELKNVEWTGLDIETVSTDYLLYTNYCLDVVIDGWWAPDAQRNGGVMTCFSARSLEVRNVEWTGNGFGLAPFNCDSFLIDYVRASGQHETYVGTPTSTRGIRPIGCLVGSINDVTIIDYDSGVKLEDCANISTTKLVTEGCERGWAISDQNPSARTKGHSLCDAIFRNSGTYAMELGGSASGDGLWTGVRISDVFVDGMASGASHAIVQRGGEAMWSNIVVRDWLASTYPFVTATADGQLSKGSLAGFRAFASVTTSRLGIFVAAAHVDFNVDLGSVTCNLSTPFAELPNPVLKPLNGYIPIPGGMLLQFGRFTITTSFANYSFPKAFPTACVAVIPICRGGSTAANVIAGTHTASQASLAGSAAVDVDYIAIGY